MLHNHLLYLASAVSVIPDLQLQGEIKLVQQLDVQKVKVSLILFFDLKK